MLSDIIGVETSDKYKDVIWQLWLQGENNAPQIVKKCFESVRYFNPDKEIIILDIDNLKDYIEIPDFIIEKYNKGIIPHAQFSDYIRLCLLAKYGGTWIDSTVLLTSKLPNEIFKSDFFAFKSLNCCENLTQNAADLGFNIPASLQKKEKFRLLPKKQVKKQTISNWFIHSKSNNKIILALLTFFNQYWMQENQLKNYFMFHIFVNFAANNDIECKEILEKMISIPSNIPHLMQYEMKNKFNEEKYIRILACSSIHKLSYKHIENNNPIWLDKILNLDFKKTQGIFKGYSI